MIVLALLVEQPGSTAYELEKRLCERFASSDWARGIAMKSLRSLQRDGLADPVEGSRARGRLRLIEWEATPDGVQHAKSWVGERITKPLLRDELYVRIVLSEVVQSDPVTLLRLLDAARTRERASELELTRLKFLEEAEDNEHRASVATDIEKAWQLGLSSYYGTARRRLEKRLEQAPPNGRAVN